MEELLKRMFNHIRLTEDEAKNTLIQIANNKFNSSQIAAFLTVFQMRPITVEELVGFRNALLEMCLPIEFLDFDTVDMCGTGGDGKDTFNISTLSSLIVAGAGYKVTKHGNYGVSSSCGSSNVLEQLGYSFTSKADKLNRQLEESNICFLHAPLFHPAMATVAPIRKEMKLKTFFNMLGPLVNPAKPSYQLTGVFNAELARLYQYVFQRADYQYSIIHGVDGFDEISLTDDFILRNNKGEYLLSPKDLDLGYVNIRDLRAGKSVAESADIFLNVLKGKGSEVQERVVCANAGMAINVINPEADYKDCYREAENSLKEKLAYDCFNSIINN